MKKNADRMTANAGNRISYEPSRMIGYAFANKKNVFTFEANHEDVFG